MLGVFLQDGHEYKEMKPRGHVICMVCGKHVTLTADTCGELCEKWRGHWWYRQERGGMVCPSCWERADDAA